MRAAGSRLLSRRWSSATTGNLRTTAETRVRRKSALASVPFCAENEHRSADLRLTEVASQSWLNVRAGIAIAMCET
jgi:hypothetical protein